MVVITDHEHALEPSINHNRSSSKESLNESIEEEQVQMLCKQMLQNRLFVGHYRERRLVDLIGIYRDVVFVHKSEMDLSKDLGIARSRLRRQFHGMWIGITDSLGPMATEPQSGVTILWVKLHDVPFGNYWFQIKQIKFREREIYLRLKVIRPLATSDSITGQQVAKTDSQESLVSSKSMATSSSYSSENIKVVEKNWAESLTEWRKQIVEDIITSFTKYVTLSNIKESFCFVIATLMAVITGMLYGIRFAGDFSIKFIREASLFVQASTPIILGVIDFFSKLVGGLYILLAMMWRGNATPERSRQPSNNRSTRPYAVPYSAPYPYRALPLPPSTINFNKHSSTNE